MCTTSQTTCPELLLLAGYGGLLTVPQFHPPLFHTRPSPLFLTLSHPQATNFEAVSFVLQSLSRGLTLSSRAIHPRFFADLLRGRELRLKDEVCEMLVVTVCMGPSVLQMKDDSNQITVDVPMVCAVVNHLRRELCTLNPEGNGLVSLYGGTCIQVWQSISEGEGQRGRGVEYVWTLQCPLHVSCHGKREQRPGARTQEMYRGYPQDKTRHRPPPPSLPLHTARRPGPGPTQPWVSSTPSPPPDLIPSQE